jgi:hypothetical protein
MIPNSPVIRLVKSPAAFCKKDKPLICEADWQAGQPGRIFLSPLQGLEFFTINPVRRSRHSLALGYYLPALPDCNLRESVKFASKFPPVESVRVFRVVRGLKLFRR